MMSGLVTNFFRNDSGAALVEYAVALIVVTIVGGAGMISVANDTGVIADTAENATNSACTTAGARVTLDGAC